MDEPPQRSLADDPSFLASLSDLDRGLSDDPVRRSRAPSHDSPPQPSSVPAPASRSAPRTTTTHRRIPLPPSIVSPFDALTFERHAQTIDPRSGDVVQTATAANIAVPRGAPPPHDGDTEAARPRLIDLRPPAAPHDGIAPMPPAAVPSRPHGESGAPPSTLEPPAPYELFYGFTETPFSLSTDPRFFFHSTPHDHVSQQMLTATRKREGLVLLTGDTGAGKTTLCRAVIEQLDRRTLTSLVTEPFVSGEDLLTTILVHFGVASRHELEHGQATSHELSTTLLSFVESLAPLQATAIVIIDEAQNLPADVLEQVRILIEAGEASALLQVVLVGQPSLTALLRRKEYRSLQQRVTVRCALGPLPADEVDAYVMHRVAVAGPSARVQFAPSAIDRIHRLSRGLPRVINLLCDRALARGHDASSAVIDAALVDAAAEDLDLGEPRSIAVDLASNAVTMIALALCGLLGAAVAARLFHDAFARVLSQFR